MCWVTQRSVTSVTGRWLWTNYYTLTAGAEFGIGNALSLFAEGGVERAFGGAIWYPRVEMGVNWHFGG